MERNGASHRITSSRPQQDAEPTRGLRPANQWTNSSDKWSDQHSHAHDDALSMSVSRHPSGGYTAEAANHGWDPHNPEEFSAGPFRTPQRAQVAAEALGQRTLNAEGGEIDKYRRLRSV